MDGFVASKDWIGLVKACEEDELLVSQVIDSPMQISPLWLPSPGLRKLEKRCVSALVCNLRQ